MVTCKNCGIGLSEEAGLLPAMRAPCANCGSLSRLFSVDIFESATAVTSVSAHYFRVEIESASVPTVIAPSNASGVLPRLGELLLYLFLTRTERINLIGDLIEDYHEASAKFGRKGATRWFYVQVFRSLWPLLRRLLFKVGIISCAAKGGSWVLKLIAQLLSA